MEEDQGEKGDMDHRSSLAENWEGKAWPRLSTTHPLLRLACRCTAASPTSRTPCLNHVMGCARYFRPPVHHHEIVREFISLL